MRNYMTGLLLGHLDTDFEEMNELYSSLGIIHLFALSGMQVGFFIDGLKKLLLRLGLTQEKVEMADLSLFPYLCRADRIFSIGYSQSLAEATGSTWC